MWGLGASEPGFDSAWFTLFFFQFFFQICFFIRALRISLYLAMCILLYNRVYILVLPHFDRDIGDYKREVVYYLRTSFLALVLLYYSAKKDVIRISKGRMKGCKGW